MPEPTAQYVQEFAHRMKMRWEHGNGQKHLDDRQLALTMLDNKIAVASNEKEKKPERFRSGEIGRAHV